MRDLFSLFFALNQSLMINATIMDRSTIVEILSTSFRENLSVGITVGAGSGRYKRIRKMISYSFMTCFAFGKVFLSDDRRCCSLVLFTDRERLSPATLFRQMVLILTVIRFRLFKVLHRETLVKKRHPAFPFYYLWFIGVEPAFQGMGKGTELMEYLLVDAKRMGRPVYLETSVEQNVSWYISFGFEVYDQLDLGYQLYFLRKLN